MKMLASCMSFVIGMLLASQVLALSELPERLQQAKPAHASSGETYACTQVLGFSQSMQWFAGSALVPEGQSGGPPQPLPMERGIFLPGWQGRFFLGGAIEEWTDPAYPGWDGEHDRAFETVAHCPPEAVERVVFNVSGTSRSPEAWAEAIDSLAEVIRSKFPAVRQVVMLPAVGSPEGMCREVRAARNHPAIVEGIRIAEERGMVGAGPEPQVADCNQFRDHLGHLTDDGARQVQQDLRTYYRDG